MILLWVTFCQIGMFPGQEEACRGGSFTMSMTVSIPVYQVGEVVGRGDGLKAIPPLALSYCCTFIYATILCNAKKKSTKCCGKDVPIIV